MAFESIPRDLSQCTINNDYRTLEQFKIETTKKLNSQCQTQMYDNTNAILDEFNSSLVLAPLMPQLVIYNM